MTMHDEMFMIITLYVASVTKNSVKTVYDHYPLSGKFRGAAHEVCNLRYKAPMFFSVGTIGLAMIVTYLLKHWEIAKEIFLAYQIMKKTPCLSRNRSPLTNLRIWKDMR